MYCVHSQTSACGPSGKAKLSYVPYLRYQERQNRVIYIKTYFTVALLGIWIDGFLSATSQIHCSLTTEKWVNFCPFFPKLMGSGGTHEEPTKTMLTEPPVYCFITLLRISRKVLCVLEQGCSRLTGRGPRSPKFFQEKGPIKGGPPLFKRVTTSLAKTPRL